MAQTSIPGSGGGCVIDGVDINTCTDDFKLNELVCLCDGLPSRLLIPYTFLVIYGCSHVLLPYIGHKLFSIWLML